MAFKSILTVVLGPDLRTEALDTAIRLARREGAHLDVLCLGVDRVQVGYYFDTASPALLEDGISRAREEAATAREAADARLAGEVVPSTVRAAVVQLGAIPEVVGNTARYADLVVQPKPYGGESETEAAAILEAALFEGHAPVLVVPEMVPDAIGKKVIIGWNESAEAVSAVRAALPVLREAASVEVLMVDPPVHTSAQSDPGTDLCRMLSRHGVKVSETVIARTMPRVSDMLLRHATENAADLIVMGAYGHSRFREAILGGATRDMLSETTVPVFMSH